MPFKILYKIGLLLLVIFSFVFCKNNTTVPAKRVQFESLPKDFEVFYNKFHTDSVYQMAHILFPLEGLPAQANIDSIAAMGQPYYWQKEQWRMHRLISFDDSLFTRTIEMPVEGMISEVVQQKHTPFGLLRRFFKRGDEWFLIYYADMNAISKTEE